MRGRRNAIRSDAIKTLFPLALLALAGCDLSSDKATLKVDAKDGLVVRAQEAGKPMATATIGGAAAEATIKAAFDVPALAAPYPGATIVSTENEGSGDERKTKVRMTTADPVARVAAFYDARFKAAGATPVVSAEADGKVARVVVGNDGRDSVAIGIEREDGLTRIAIESGKHRRG